MADEEKGAKSMATFVCPTRAFPKEGMEGRVVDIDRLKIRIKF